MAPFRTEKRKEHIYWRHIYPMLMQVVVDGKANEKAPLLVYWWRLTFRDAMFTQRDLCEQIVEAGGNYIFLVWYRKRTSAIFPNLSVIFQ